MQMKSPFHNIHKQKKITKYNLILLLNYANLKLWKKDLIWKKKKSKQS